MDAGENRMRQAKYRKDPVVEDDLGVLNSLLSNLDPPHGGDAEFPVLPPLFLVGLPRTGTTLLMQLLVQIYRTTYPDNVVARFWGAPHLGVVVSRSLRRQFGFQQDHTFRSDYGVVQDLFGPHEFGYFWKKWFPFGDTHDLNQAQLGRVNTRGLLRMLGLMEQFGRAPLVFKTVPLSFSIPFLAALLPKARFIWVDRDPLFVGQSILEARQERYGTIEQWWSIRPREYGQLRGFCPVHQVAGQVHYTRRGIERALGQVGSRRWIRISYEDMCRDCSGALEQCESLMEGMLEPRGTEVPPSFSCRNEVRISPPTFQELEEAVRGFESGALSVGQSGDETK